MMSFVTSSDCFNGARVFFDCAEMRIGNYRHRDHQRQSDAETDDKFLPEIQFPQVRAPLNSCFFERDQWRILCP
jgi:hypothetical protein